MKNWDLKKLGEVCEFYNGKAHEKSIDENGKYKVVNSKFVSSNGTVAKRTEVAQFPLFKDDIVMVMSDVPNGKTLAKCFLIDKDDTYSLNQRVCAIRTDVFDKKFLYYQLNRNPYFLAFNNGENQTNLRKKDILDCPLLIPPIEEQKKIVELLETSLLKLNEAIEFTQQNIINAKELFDSQLVRIFTEHTKRWQVKRFKDVCEKITDGTHQTPKYFDEGVIFLSSKNVTTGKIDWENVKYIDNKQHLEMHKRVAPKLNDILLAKNGTTGVAALVDKDVVFDIYVSLAHIRVLDEILPEFMLHFINSPLAKKQFNKRLKGVGVPNLHLQEIREVQVIYPTSKVKQQEIVDYLNKLLAKTKALENQFRKKTDELEFLKMAIWHKAFSGELNKKELA